MVSKDLYNVLKCIAITGKTFKKLKVELSHEGLCKMRVHVNRKITKINTTHNLEYFFYFVRV